MKAECLKQECDKNYDAALKAFYQIFPYGMLAHFTANSAILEAKPHNAELLHIIDFDIGDGLQWSSMISALAQQKIMLNQRVALKVTAIKWKEEEDCGQRRFEDTKRRLHICAIASDVKLKVDEIEFQDLESEIKRMKKRGGDAQFLAFNCMWSLPHMGRRRSRNQFLEFVSVAKDYTSANNNGVITIGDGDALERSKNCHGFASFFDSYMEHYRALLESIEHIFSPVGLVEGRTAMECIFVAPFVSCVDWKQMVEERKEGKYYYDFKYGFKEIGLSNECLLEAKELVRGGGGGGKSLYGVRIEGENVNEMVLEWKGTPLVRVSAWGRS